MLRPDNELQPTTRRYLVTIFYREPTYQRHTYGNVDRLHAYRGSYEVHARDADTATRLAVRAFERTAALSGSGWVRSIVDVRCQLLDDDVRCEVLGQD